MRSHAKASTAGSTQRQAGSLGRFFRGALAIRGASPASKGSGALKAKRLVLPTSVFAAILALVIVAGSASAANGVVNFFGGTGVQGGQFSSSSGGLGGVAVNQEGTGGATAGDVYVVDRGNNRVQQLTAAGVFVRAFGLNVGGAGVNVCTVAASCVAGTASAAAGGMSAPQGIAIDQSNGNVYVTDQSNRRIDVFSANGTFQAAFGYGVDTGAAALELCTTASTCAAGTSGANAGQFGAQIGYPAVAPAGSPNAGHLYVADKSNRRVDQLEPTLTAGEVTGIAFVKGWGWGVDSGASAFEQCTTASVCQAPNTSSPTTNPGQFSSNQPQALAVDSNGNVYTAESAGNNRAQKFDSTGNPVAFSATELTGSPGPQDIAVDKTNNRVFAIKEPTGAGERRILEFNSAGAFLATHASGTTITSANGFALPQGSTNFYMSTSSGVSGAPGVFFLGTKVNPTASVEAPSPLTSHSATLKGEVNPQGFSTSYRFEFSSDGGFTWTNVPATDVNVGAGTSDVAVEQSVNGLIGGHEYLYKIVATKPFGAGSVTTGSQVFTAPASAPTIAATFSSAVTTKTAILNAQINPENQATSYHFEYGTADCASNPCTSVPLSDSLIGSGEDPISVAKEIAGLEPDTTYHFRVLATNASGTTEGPDQTFTTYEVFVPKTDCPNQTFRTGPSALLPDCRAYEMVSPVDKNGGEILNAVDPLGGRRAEYVQASPDGDKVTYSSNASFGDQPSNHYSNQYIASRGLTGWSSDGINTPQGTTLADPDWFGPDAESYFFAFSPDLSSAWLWDFNKTPLTPDGISGFTNLYRRDNLDDTFEALTNVPPIGGGNTGDNNVRYFEYQFEGFSDDLSHSFFTAAQPLAPNAAASTEKQIYEFSGDAPHLVSVLPDGTASPEKSTVGNGGKRGGEGLVIENAVSDDGRRVFWISGGRLYLRENPAEEQSALTGGECTEPAKACTIDITALVPGSFTSFGAYFEGASADGSKVLFSFYVNSGTLKRALYEYDVETETSTLIAGESVKRSVGFVGASDDLSHIYFVSDEALAPGATAGQINLYLRQEAANRFIANLADIDVSRDGVPSNFAYDIDGPPSLRASRVSPDGRYLAFQSIRSLTGYDNTDAINGEPDVEVFHYDAETDELSCASCNPSGARPVGAELPQPFRYPETTNTTGIWAAAWIPGSERELQAQRVLSADGELFFNSHDSLVPLDTNGVMDVYQWKPQGSGGCQEPTGCVDLISTGESAQVSEFIDADANGDEVFFTTKSSIAPQDPGLIDLYVARVGGGLPAPPEIPVCTGDSCQSIPPAPNDPTPASASFRGAGDPLPAKARKRRKCRVRRTHGAEKGAATKRAKRCRRANRRAGR